MWLRFEIVFIAKKANLLGSAIFLAPRKDHTVSTLNLAISAFQHRLTVHCFLIFDRIAICKKFDISHSSVVALIASAVVSNLIIGVPSQILVPAVKLLPL